MNTAPKSKLIWYAILVVVALAPALATSRIRSVGFRCMDADSPDTEIQCTVSIAPATTTANGVQISKFDLVQPQIEADITANSSDYLSRHVRLDVAIYPQDQLVIKVYLAKRLPDSLNPTLQDVLTLRQAVEKGAIDRAIALSERIVDPSDGSTFSTRYVYWNAVALFNACTRLFYATCQDARDAKDSILDAISRHKKSFSDEQIDTSRLRTWDADFDAVAIRTSFARAHWFQSVKAYSDAQSEYDAVIAAIAGKSKDFLAKAGVDGPLLDKEVALLKTLSLSSPNS